MFTIPTEKKASSVLISRINSPHKCHPLLGLCHYLTVKDRKYEQQEPSLTNTVYGNVRSAAFVKQKWKTKSNKPESKGYCAKIYGPAFSSLYLRYQQTGSLGLKIITDIGKHPPCRASKQALPVSNGVLTARSPCEIKHP